MFLGKLGECLLARDVVTPEVLGYTTASSLGLKLVSAIQTLVSSQTPTLSIFLRMCVVALWTSTDAFLEGISTILTFSL